MKKINLTFEKACTSVGQSILVYIAIDLARESLEASNKKRAKKREEKKPDDILIFKDPLNGNECSPEDTAEMEITAE